MKVNNDFLRDIQVLVLEDVESSSLDFFYKTMCKWYSKTYFTPLLTVMNDIDPEHVARVFYEDRFQKLAESDDEAAAQEWARIKDMLLMDEEELEEYLQEEQIDEEEEQDWIKELINANKEEKTKAAEEPEMPTQELSPEEQKIFDEGFNFSLSDDGDD